jgi:hypothetical protein
MQQFAHSFLPTAPPMMFTKSFAETAASYLQHGGIDTFSPSLIISEIATSPPSSPST